MIINEIKMIEEELNIINNLYCACIVFINF